MLRSIHARAVRLLSEGMRDLGVFPHMSAEAIEQHTYRSCFPHSVGEPCVRVTALVVCDGTAPWVCK